ncbi:TPA: superinfection exclusion protein B, partial [Escherichia coli]
MSNWWQELLRFFLRGLTLQQLIHMLIILIALIIITPASIKEWVDIR